MPARPAFYVNEVLAGQGAVALQQGDILARVPFPTFNLQAANIVRAGRPINVDFTSESTVEAEDYLLSTFQVYPALIITQTCDLERGDRPVLVCAIRPYHEIFKDQEIGSSGFLKRIKEFSNPGRKPNMLPLPPFTGWETLNMYSIADFGLVTNIAAPNRSSLLEARRARLSVEALSLLQERLTSNFGRFAANEGIFLSDQDFAKAKAGK